MKEEVFYKHGRRNAFHKDYTVCGKVVEINSQHVGADYDITTYELHIGISVCHLEDTFTKKVGTKLAYERATSEPMLKIALQGDRSYMQYKSFVDSFIPVQALYTHLTADFAVETH